MTLHIFESTYRDLPCWKCVVRLHYKKDDKKFKVQKTYLAVGEVFRVDKEQVDKSFRAAAVRWEQQTLERIKNGQQPELKQEEIKISPTPLEIMKAHQYLYYQGKAVWSDYKYDQFCEANGLNGSGGSDVKSDYSPEIISLAGDFVKNPHMS